MEKGVGIFGLRFVSLCLRLTVVNSHFRLTLDFITFKTSCIAIGPHFFGVS